MYVMRKFHRQTKGHVTAVPRQSWSDFACHAGAAIVIKSPMYGVPCGQP